MSTHNAMIWGASGGIGRALTQHLVEEGWSVLAIARAADGLHSVTDFVQEADVSDAATVEQAVALAARDMDAINLWVYAVGDIAAVPAGDMATADWQRILNANLTGAFLAAHHKPAPAGSRCAYDVPGSRERTVAAARVGGVCQC